MPKSTDTKEELELTAVEQAVLDEIKNSRKAPHFAEIVDALVDENYTDPAFTRSTVEVAVRELTNLEKIEYSSQRKGYILK